MDEPSREGDGSGCARTDEMFVASRNEVSKTHAVSEERVVNERSMLYFYMMVGEHGYMSNVAR